MGVARFVVGLLRQAPNKLQMLRSLALGGRGGNRSVAAPDGTRLSVRRSGDGDPLVLVHGSLDTMGAFSLTELAFADDYDVWVYDRRGRGASGDHSDYSLDAEVDDLRSVVAATGGTPHIVAHSFGAVIAMHARRAGVPMRSLTLYEPPLNGSEIEMRHIDDVRSAVDDDRLDDAIRLMAREIAGVGEEELGVAMKVPPVRKSLRDGVRVVGRELDAIREHDGRELGVLDVPTLFVRGEASRAPVYPTGDQIAELAPNGEVVTIDGQGHLAHTFSPSTFVQAVKGFTGRH